jgi:SAM-dependent methyltransferase
MDGEPARDALPAAPYVLGHSAQELERLMLRARLYDPFTSQVFRDAGLAPGMRVLDVGAGSGDVSFLAARLVGPTGQVVGVDRAPEAVAMATRRALALELSNTRFMVGDASTVTFEASFDGAVGRLVLMHCAEPAAVVQQVATQVRPGGVVVFQEPDWTGYRSHPALPTWDRCARWIVEALQGSGADPFAGLQLSTTFVSAGLPPPALYLHAPIAAGPHAPLCRHAAALVASLLPAIERLGIASAVEVEVDTLSARLQEELASSGGTVVWTSMIGAVARVPTQEQSAR